jgi:arylsulfatase A-like enzyme
MPSCAATRASLLGGRYPFRHGIGALVRSTDAEGEEDPGDPDDPDDPDERGTADPSGVEPRTVEFGVGPGNVEVTLAHLARAAGLRSLQAGKWHLALRPQNAALGGAPGAGWEHVRAVAGFDDCWTVWGNLSERGTEGDPWSSFEVGLGGELGDGSERVEGIYATTAQVDRVLAWTAARGDEPWLVWSAFNAVHAPFALPPEELVATGRYLELARRDRDEPNPSARSDWPLWCAMIEALDAELGRLLDGLDEQGQLERTLVVFLGDNGSPEQVMGDAWRREDLGLGETFGRLVRPRAERFKHTVWEPGVRVPLIVSGPGVAAPGRSSDALVDAPDLWETVRELPGLERAAVLPEGHHVDGVSLLDVLRSADEGGAPGTRRFSLVEHFEPQGNPELIGGAIEAGSPGQPGQPGQPGAGVLRRGYVLATERGRFKLVREAGARDRVYQLEDASGRAVDPWEQAPLATGRDGAERALLEELRAGLEALLRTEARNWGG